MRILKLAETVSAVSNVLEDVKILRARLSLREAISELEFSERCG